MDIAIQGCNSGRIPKEKSEMDHPEKLAAQNEEKQNKNTTQQVLDTIVHKTHKQRKQDIRKRK
jgi:hypothetical protein